MNKGMPLWEQHLEKIVLGLSVLILLGVLAMTVLGTTEISAEIDGRSYGAAEVDQVMVEKAQELGRRLSPDAESDVTAFVDVDVAGADLFTDRIRKGVSPEGALPRIAPALAAALLPEEVGAVDVWYHEPRIPALRMIPQVVQTVDTIEPEALAQVAELSSLVDGSGDVVWTTPVAVLDLEAIRRELEVEDTRASPPRNQIPSNWYNEKPYVLDVVFERQRLGDDGVWSNAEIVDTLPGALELRSQIRQARDEDSLNASFKEFVWLNLDDKVKQLEVLQPEFYDTLNDRLAIGEAESFDEVEPEEPAVDDAEASRRQQETELKRRIKDRIAAAARLEATLDELGGELREEDEPDAGGDSGRGGRGSAGGRGGGGGGEDPNGGGFGPGGSAGGRNRGPAEGSASDKRRRISLTRKLDRTRDEITRLQEQLSSLNPDAEEIEVDLEVTASLPDLAEADELLVWGHDLGVEPGATYRYRSRAVLFNPFFARGRQLLPEQQSLAEPIELESAMSDWSDPVTIDPPVTFFVVQANDRGGSYGIGEVRVQVYRYFEGGLRSEQFTVQPGERIGRTATVDGLSVDFSTDWYIVDIVDDPAAPEAAGLDREDNGTVICRRLDGRERRIDVPSRQRADPKRANLEIDIESAADRG